MCSANALYPQLQTEIYRGNDLSSLVGFREESQASERFISLSLLEPSGSSHTILVRLTLVVFFCLVECTPDHVASTGGQKKSQEGGVTVSSSPGHRDKTQLSAVLLIINVHFLWACHIHISLSQFWHSAVCFFVILSIPSPMSFSDGSNVVSKQEKATHNWIILD